MRLPSFLILGAPKCGTTALAQALSTHPDVFLSRPKEPHFFDAAYEKGLRGYFREHFADLTTERAPGEATPSYLTVPYVAQRIHRTLPTARLVAILRHPVERAYSSWWMFHARGMEPLSFEAAIDENERQLRASGGIGLEADELVWQAHVAALRKGARIQVRTYLQTGYYARHLRRYLDYFPRDQLKVVFNQDFSRNRDATVRGIWQHIGVADDVELLPAARVNEAIGGGAVPLLSAARALGLMRLRALVPESLKTRIKAGLSGIGEQPGLEPPTRQRLLDHYAHHNRELEKMLGVDLPGWKQ